MDNKLDLINKMASELHEEWRRGFDPEKTGKERIKKSSDGTEININKPYDELTPEWQKENFEAAKAAMEAIEQFPNDEERAAEHVHNEWMKRNPKADWNEHQHVPYGNLTDGEKEKDLVHIRIAKKIVENSFGQSPDTLQEPEGEERDSFEEKNFTKPTLLRQNKYDFNNNIGYFYKDTNENVNDMNPMKLNKRSTQNKSITSYLNPMFGKRGGTRRRRRRQTKKARRRRQRHTRK